MNKHIFKLILVNLVLIIITCSDKPTDVSGNSSEETNTLTGHLYYENGAPAIGATVNFITVDHNPTSLSKSLTIADSVVTDKNGEFSVDELPDGIYNIYGSGNNKYVYKDSITITTDSTINLPPDTLKTPGSLKGVIKIQPEDDPRLVDVIFWGTTFGVVPDSTGYFEISTMSAGEYPVRIRLNTEYAVIDTSINIVSGEILDLDTIELPFLGVPIPRGLSTEYDTLNGRVILTWNNANNSNIEGYIVYRNDTSSATPIRISGSELIADTFYLDTIFNDLTDTNTFIYEYRLKAQDSAANQSKYYSSSVQVTAVPPSEVKTTFVWTTLNTINDTASINDSISIVVNYENPNRLNSKISWYINTFDSLIREVIDSSLIGSDTLNHSWNNPGNKKIYVKITDAGDSEWIDSFTVPIILDIPSISISGNSSISINTPITFTANVSQKFGNIVKYRWDNGVEVGYDDSSGSGYTYTFLVETTLIVILEVTDDDGNTSTANHTLVITNDDPIIMGLKDTSISINNVVTFNVTATDSNGIK